MNIEEIFELMKESIAQSITSLSEISNDRDGYIPPIQATTNYIAQQLLLALTDAKIALVQQ